MLEDLDYADDIALLASNCTHMQEKSSRLQAIGSFMVGSFCHVSGASVLGRYQIFHLKI